MAIGKADEARIEALQEKLAEVAEQGEREFLPPMSEAAVAKLEKKLGVELPELHREFLRKVTAGERDPGAPVLLEPAQGLKSLPKKADPAKPFPLGDAEVAGLLRADARRKKDGPVPALDAPWDGLLPLMDYGDGDLDCLVLAGPQRGKVWHAFEAGFRPHLGHGEHPAKAPLGFLEWAEEVIEEAANEGAGSDDGELEQSNKGLTEITPALLKRAAGATRLVLSVNKLASLPPGIGGLTALEDLILDGNQLTSLPAELGDLKSLKRLSVADNQLTSLPPEIGQLGALGELSVNDNPLTALPETLGKLKALRKLDVSRTQLRELPASLGASGLTHLVIKQGPLRTLPASLATSALEVVELRELASLDYDQELPVLLKIASLRELRIHAADKKLSKASLAGLGKLKNLTALSLVHAGLTELPGGLFALEKLETLGLDSNQLKALPEALFALPRLKQLVLFRNLIPKDELARLRAAHPKLEISG